MAGSKATNDQAVQFEEQQAAQAAQQEAARQQRLQQGQAAINSIFNGQPVMGSRQATYDWSGFTPPSLDASGNQTASGAPPGYTAFQTTKPGATTGGATTGGVTTSRTPTPVYGGANASSGGWGSVYQGAQPGGSGAGAGTGQMTWALKDASGNVYYQGQPFNYQQSYDTGQTAGGFDDNFYNNYKQQYLNYYLPDEQKQYAEAKRDLAYGLANSGTLNSSAAADAAGKLAYTDTMNQASIQNQANQSTGQLQSQIQGEKQSLINQLYATEDPTLTANLAESAAKGFQLQTPTLTPAAALFTPIVTGAASAASNLLSPYMPYGGSPYAQYGAGGGTNVASAGASSGQYTAR